MSQPQGIRIGRILGIPIYLDLSWILIFVWIAYIMQKQFRGQFANWSTESYWGLGMVTAFLFFASVLFHELSHSVVAQHYKIKVISITLFLFGGLARIGREPTKASQEFNIAIAGPLASGFLAALFYGVELLFPGNAIVSGPADVLCKTNLALALFNLLPGFP